MELDDMIEVSLVELTDTGEKCVCIQIGDIDSEDDDAFEVLLKREEAQGLAFHILHLVDELQGHASIESCVTKQ